LDPTAHTCTACSNDNTNSPSNSVKTCSSIAEGKATACMPGYILITTGDNTDSGKINRCKACDANSPPNANTCTNSLSGADTCKTGYSKLGS